MPVYKIASLEITDLNYSIRESEVIMDMNRRIEIRINRYTGFMKEMIIFPNQFPFLRYLIENLLY